MSQKEDAQTRFKSTIFYALSDSLRLDIVNFLRQGERCVCEIAPHLNIVQSLASRHLKILKDAGIIKCRKDGTKRLYSIVDQRIFNIVDPLTPELLGILKKEAIESVVY